MTAKITKEIKQEYILTSNNVRQVEIARKYNVSQSTISEMIKRVGLTCKKKSSYIQKEAKNSVKNTKQN